jgi:hypothetical protein
MSRISRRVFSSVLLMSSSVAALVLMAARPRPLAASGLGFDEFACPSNPALSCVMNGLHNPRGIAFGRKAPSALPTLAVAAAPPTVNVGRGRTRWRCLHLPRVSRRRRRGDSLPTVTKGDNSMTPTLNIDQELGPGEIPLGWSRWLRVEADGNVARDAVIRVCADDGNVIGSGF